LSVALVELVLCLSSLIYTIGRTLG
jgi:hypothetical protein